jgi:hypothetical protein
MPRDVGTGVYKYPDGTPGNPGQTIFSTRYNTFINDLSNTLNQALPINVGGTGATNAAQARDNLDAEVAAQVVTDYAFHTWEPGSFTSGLGAIGGPVIDHYILGYVAGTVATGAVQIEAYDISVNPVARYTRVYRGGAWEAWVATDAIADARYVNTTGDTMTGSLTINTSNPTLTLRKDGGGQVASVFGQSGLGSPRWQLQLGDGAAESGANAGSNFSIYQYTDGGVLFSQPALTISRATGDAIFSTANGVSSRAVADATQGAYRFGNGGVARLYWNGTLFGLEGGPLTIPGGGLQAAGGISSNISGTDGTFYFGSTAANYLTYSSGKYVLNGGQLSVNNTIIAGSSANTGTLYLGTDAAKYIQGTSGGVIVLNSAGTRVADLTIINQVTPTTGVIYWGNGGATYLFWDTAKFMFSGGSMQLGTGFHSRAGTTGAYGGNVHNFNWATPGSLLQAYIDTINIGNVTVTSDYRIKKDVTDLPTTWDTVKALRPIKYTQAQFTPASEIKRRVEEAKKSTVTIEGKEAPATEFQPMFEADDIERWGFIAHELQATLVSSAATGVKDSPDTVQSPNPWTVIAALTKALQEAMARIEALEAAQSAP